MSGSTNAPTVQDVVGKLIKPGTKTSEFAGLVAMYATMLAAVLGAFNTASPTANAWIKGAALIAGSIGTVGYAISRGNVKQALADLVAEISTVNPALIRVRPPAAPATPPATPPAAPPVAAVASPPAVPPDAGAVTGVAP